jgi:hypothetical protein
MNREEAAIRIGDILPLSSTHENEYTIEEYALDLKALRMGAAALHKLDKLQKMLDEGRRDGILNWAYYEIEEVINESS